MKLAYVDIARLGGYVALALLCLALCATPLGRLLARSQPEHARRVARVRRALGIGAASAALVHAMFAFGALETTPTLLWSWPHLRLGLLALVVLALLLATSFPALVRALRLGAWKELHRLAYLALVLAFAHALLGPFSSPLVLGGMFACTLLFGLLRALRVPPPAR